MFILTTTRKKIKNKFTHKIYFIDPLKNIILFYFTKTNKDKNSKL